MPINLEDLKQQISYRWKVQSYNKDQTKGSCVAYIDARDAMDILDKVVGANRWQDKYEFIGDKLIAGVGIFDDEKQEWVWKYDTGTESATEKEKGIFSDAFKRACVKWGIGRFLYDLEIKWVKVSNKKPVDDNGNIIWDLTKHFNSQVTSPTAPQQTKPTNTTSSSPAPTKYAEQKIVTFKLQDKTLGTAVCNECNSHMVYFEGIAKTTGKPWSKLMCEGDKSHIAWYPKVEKATNWNELNKLPTVIADIDPADVEAVMPF